MNFKSIFYGLAITLFVFNCSSSSDDDMTAQPDPDPDPTPTEKVTYNADIKSIISSNCTSCHGSTLSNNAPMSLTTYAQVSSYIDAILDRINRTGAGKMPVNGTLSTTQKNLIQKWKDDGLLEN
ncbi:hypothetical protein [Aestuariibaculum lutulentum]|uniref:Cytochrome c domain-containing protein n=1 Tax=Aestuariibaculum lutulentum TaxID=2920935 RepID=A0ABS9RHQ0_9FLAO|nr:hypothetical protein [Aestuariibaculum lutulentum]MCH4552468.1 hypothetical protein [Aestuariibaculum lutulentum]